MARHPLLRKMLGFQYSIPVNIYSKRANGGHVQTTDHAMRVERNDGTYCYELKGRGDIDAAKLGELSGDGKFNVFEPEYGTFIPLKLNMNDFQLEPVDSDDRAFVAYNFKRSKELYKNPKNLTQLLTMVLPVVILGMMIIGGLLIFKSVSEGVAGVQGQNKEIMVQQTGMMEMMQDMLNQSGKAAPPVETGNYTW